MKQLVLIIFVPLVLIGQTNSLPQSVQEKINQAKDYYDVSLYEDSKKLLLELLHSEEGKNNEAEIRYYLGLASYYEGNINDARIQWKQVILKYPTHERSRQLNRIMANYISSSEENEMFREEEFEYSQDRDRGRRFWTPIPLNEKLFWGELKDARRAIVYYNTLVDKYDDPKKKFQLLYIILLIHSGYNNDSYGYGSLNVGSEKTKFFNRGHLMNINNILNRMENQITDETDLNYGSLIQAYYLCGVKVSGSSLFSGKVIVNEKSKPFFEKVIEMTETSENNIYRLFSQHWLNK